MTTNNRTMQYSEELLKDSEIDRQLQRILKPSQSTKNILQQQFQSRIESIEQCLTSRTNFLMMFQQMLQQQLQQNANDTSIKSNQHNHNHTQINQINQIHQNDQINQIHQNDQINQINQIYYLQKQVKEHQAQHLNQEEQKQQQQLNTNYHTTQIKGNNISKEQAILYIKSSHQKQIQYSHPTSIKISNEQTINTDNKQTIKTNNKLTININNEQNINSYKKQTKLINNKQTKLINNKQTINTQTQTINTYTQTIQCRQLNRKRQYIFQIKNVKNRVKQVEQQLQKVKLYISSSFEFLKLYLVKQIFQSNLKKIVQIIDNNYSKKYQLWTKQMTSLNQKMKQQHQKQINRLNSIIKHKQQQFSHYQQQSNHINHYNIKNFNNNRLLDINDFDNTLQLQSNTLQLQSIIKPEQQSQIFVNSNKRSKQQYLSLNRQLLDQDQHTNYQTTATLSKVRQCQMSSSLIKVLKCLNFTINLPLQLPTINSQQCNQTRFITINQKSFSYKGYITSNQFTSSGTLQFKDLNIIYQGQFTNHKLNGKGKLTINLSNHMINKSKLYNNNNNNKQNIPLKSIKDPNKQIYTKFKQLIIIGKFINNSLQGYAKVTLIEQKNQPINNINNNQINSKLNSQSNTIFTIWKNNKIIKTL